MNSGTVVAGTDGFTTMTLGPTTIPATGVNLVHVPYRGAGPALVDLLGGQVQVMFASMSSSIEYVRAGKVRALAVTIATRTPVLPDLPTVAEFVPGYEFSFWTGIGAPRIIIVPDQGHAVREPSPHHSNGIDVPMKRQASLGCVGIRPTVPSRVIALSQAPERGSAA